MNFQGINVSSKTHAGFAIIFQENRLSGSPKAHFHIKENHLTLKAKTDKILPGNSLYTPLGQKVLYTIRTEKYYSE